MTSPAWSSAFDAQALTPVTALPVPRPTREWAWGGATGAGIKVAVIDSGIEGDHPRVGGVAGSVAFEPDADEETGYRIVEGPHADLVGHGTACAAIIRSLAPDADIYSVRVLGSNLKGKGALFLGGIRWAVEQQIHVANLSLSTGREQWFGPLHDLADEAYFKGVLLVCAANYVPGPTYPSQYSSVVSVAARQGEDPFAIAYNPRPPVEFGASGIDIEVAWSGGTSIVATGNSFATPHVAGLAARVLSKHPGLTPFQVKSVLQAVADNAR
jgi:subtilisin